MSRLRVTLVASLVVSALVASTADAHNRVGTAAGHAAEDAVTHSAAQERALDAHTRRVTAFSANLAAAAVAAAPQDVGQWSPVVDWPVVGVHVALLPNGKVLAYDSVGDNATETYPVHDHTRATIWDPATGSHTPVNVDTGFNIFCSGLAHLADGRMFFAGGNKDAQLNGIIQTHLFDPLTNLWSLGPNMAAGRWYPSVTPLSNGEMLITSGGADTPEVRTVAGGLRALTTASEASLGLPLYPWVDVAPKGGAFVSGPNTTMRLLTTAGTGAWQALGQRDSITRDYGSHVVFDVGKILVAGGDAPATRDTRVVDLNGAAPQVSTTAPMAFPRRQHNLTVLADGTVLATGGLSSSAGQVDLTAAVYAAEQWNPAAGGQWRTLAAMQIPRQYHSTALLLPDGRVLSSGGGLCGVCDAVGYLAKNAEIFSPPYLFKADGTLAPRPAIDAAPTATSYGAAMEIATPNPASISKVALVRLGAVTHSNNMEQRYIPLLFTAGANSISATAPANANIAPPGRYMLFIIDANGVPSVASMVTVQGNSPPAVALTQPTDGATFTPPATVDLVATASDADGSVAKVEFFNGAAKLGEDTTAPYGYTWNAVAAGTYALTARVTDNLGASTTSATSTITVSTQPTLTCPQGRYLAEYFANQTLSGQPAFTRCELTIANEWGAGGPGNGLGNDNFSVRWTGRFDFAADVYSFTARADDGVRLWVDGQQLIAGWVDQSATTYQANRTLTTGLHEVKLEFYENWGDAVAQLEWVGTNDHTPPSAPSALTATAVSPGQINLAWTASTDNVALTGYLVERCQGAGCTDFVQVATPSGIFYNDTDRSPATSYSYRVRAIDAAGNLSGYSSVQSAITPQAGICSRSSAVWLTGMEHGVVSTAGGGIFSSLTGSPTADNTVARSGAYSLLIGDASAGSTVRALRSVTASSVVVTRFAVRLSSLPGVNANLAYVDSSTDLVFRYNATSQRFQLTLGSVTVTATTPVSAATWYVIDLRYDVSASPHLGDWRVNGVTQTQVSRIATPTTANGFGMGSTANASVYTANYDDIFVATQPTAYPMDDSHIVRLVPDSMGTSSGAGNFRNNDGTAIDSSSWQRLDDVPMTSTADYVRQQANNGSSYVEFGFQDMSEACIREVSAILAYHAAGTSSDRGKTSVFEGATETVVFNGDMSQTGLQYKREVVTPGAGTWNQAALNGLAARVGYSTDSSPNPYWDSIMLEAAVP